MPHSGTSTSSLADAVAALDDLDWLRGILVGKATKQPPLPSILTENGFVRQVLRESRLLQKEVGLVLGSKPMRDALLASSGIDWRGATPRQRTRAIDAMTKMIKGLPTAFAPGVRAVLDKESMRIVSGTHRQLGKRYKTFTVDPTFALKNTKAIAAINDSTSIFFAPEYERQATKFRPRAQDTMARGLADGLGSKQIGAQLRREFRETAINRNYWDTVAATHVNRSRSFSSAATYAANGIEQYQVVAVMDERTTEICFPPGTPVSTGGGSTTPIEKCRPGSFVLGRDGEDHVVEAVSVSEASEWVRLTLESSAEIEATPDHPFWIEDRGWVGASRIEIGDSLKTFRDTIRVVGASRVQETKFAINLQVADDPVYFVHRVLVHNCTMMNDTILPVEGALDRFDAMEGAKDLDEVKAEVPFMQARGGAIVLPTGAQVATIKPDGGFGNKMSAEHMNENNVGMPPYHHRCYPGSTVVQGRVLIALRSFYSGEMIEVATKRGARVTLTINHPVLTPEGFVAAKALRRGDDLLRYRGDPHDPAVGPADHLDEQHEPTKVEQVFDSLRERGGVLRVDSVPDDLHGEAKCGNGKVDVVAVDRELLLHLQAETTQAGREAVFVEHVPAPLLSTAVKRSCSRSEFGVGDPTTSRRPPRLATLFLRCGLMVTMHAVPPPLQPLGFGPASQLDPVLSEDSLHGILGDAMLASDLLGTEAGQVVVDQVVEIGRFPASCHVYDLQTVGGWTVADGAIVSNCRTTVVPVFQKV